MPFWTPIYALEANIIEQIAIVIISRVNDLSINKILDITDEINGNDIPRPTPAAHIIAPMKIISRDNL